MSVNIVNITMSKEDDIVSQFLLNTCRRQPAKHTVEASTFCPVPAKWHPSDDDEAQKIPLTTGSAAEFYIDPMLSCVGDTDLMYYDNNKLAIPAGYPPPTQLPDEFHDYVKIFEIIDSHFPSYVYLKLRYLLTVSIHDVEYNVTQYEQDFHLQNTTYAVDGERGQKFHGPAVSYPSKGNRPPHDRVWSTRCLLWPTQASDWPTRHRSYGWPDSATISRVISDGCDLVGVAHRQCGHDKWMGEHQWRLSFSRAEIVLLNSWMPVQQIVYHMVRTFVKTEKLTEVTDNTGSKMFSNYHIKTLMLWACEQKTRTWWTDDLKLAKMCVELLHTLAVSFSHKRCQNYFIGNCNLMDVTRDTTAITIQLMSVSESWLAVWFINNYICKCAQMCPKAVSQLLFDDVGTIEKLQHAVTAVVHWRNSNKLGAFCDLVFLAKWLISYSVHSSSLSVRSCICWMTELPKIDQSLSLYFIAVAFLHVATKLQNDTKKLFDILATIVDHFVGLRGTRRYCSQHSSVLSLSKAAEFMKVVAKKSHASVQLIMIELAKEYLHRALRYKDADTAVIYCLVNVYLGVLSYTTGQYQTAIYHCKQVDMSLRHSPCSSHVVQGELLPEIEDNIDNVLGLAVLYQYVKTAALNQQQHTKPVSVFTTELFAHYMHIRCMSATKCLQTSLSYEVQRYGKYFTDVAQLSITDVLLRMLLMSSIQLNHCDKPVETMKWTTQETEPNTSKLVELLQQSAVEHLTAYRHLEAQQFYPVAPVFTTDFEALYAYKLGDYQRCLQLSTQNVHTFLAHRGYGDLLTVPVFIQLLDDDIVSLTALTLIVNRKCQEQINYVHITQLTLSLFLMIKCQMKLRQPVTSLTQTLDYIEVTQRRHRTTKTLDHLTLKLTERKLLTHITMLADQ